MVGRLIQHQNMRVTMVMHDQYAFHRAAHAEVFIVVLQPLKACGDGRILFGLRLFRAEGEVGQRVPGNRMVAYSSLFLAGTSYKAIVFDMVVENR